MTVQLCVLYTRSTPTCLRFRVYIQMNVQEYADIDFKMMTTFPKKIFSVEDYERPLEELGELF